MRLRRAEPDDIGLLMSWDSKLHVIAGKGTEPWAWETELPRRADWQEMLIAELDGKPIGFVQIVDPAEDETHYWGDMKNNLRAIDIWIGEEAYVGKGHGTTIMQLAIARCFAEETVEAILVDPIAHNVRAHRFYERLGFRFVECRRFGVDDCFVYRLDRENRVG